LAESGDTTLTRESVSYRGVRGTRSNAASDEDYRFDTLGVLTFMVTMVALQVLATQGSTVPGSAKRGDVR